MLQHVAVQCFPEAQENGSVGMALVSADLRDCDVPLAHIGLERKMVILEVEGLHVSKDVLWRAIRQAPGPALELPGGALHKHGYNSIPVSRAESQGLVHDSVVNPDSAGRVPRWPRALASLDESFLGGPAALSLLGLGRHEAQVLEKVCGIQHGD